MFTRFVHNSVKIGTFLDDLVLELSKPQPQHMLNLNDSLLVCEDTKTLANPQTQFVTVPDVSTYTNRAGLTNSQGEARFTLPGCTHTSITTILPVLVTVTDTLGVA